MNEEANVKPWSMARVVTASSAGTAFEWYDFFIFGSLTPVIAKVFLAGLDPTSALIAALALFAVGFAFRPLGAIIFGVVGDRLGRKRTFVMGLAVFSVASLLCSLAPTVELLSWLSTRTRTYDEAIEAWHSHCPRLTVWEDALVDGFIRIERRGDGKSTVAVTERGRATLVRVAVSRRAAAARRS